MAPITKARRWPFPLGLMDPYGLFHPEITAIWVTLEGKNVPLNPPQTWGVPAQKDTPPVIVLDPLFTGHAPITKR